MAKARGGARHRSKTMLESGAVFKCLEQHTDIVRDFRGYETLSRNSGVDWKALMHCLPLVEGLLGLCSKAEVHPLPLRQGLVQLLTTKPDLNKTRFNGSTWVQLRAERVVVLLNHVRKLARDPKAGNAICKLSGVEYARLMDVLQMVTFDDEPLEKAQTTSAASKKAASSAKGARSTCSVKVTSRKLTRAVSEDDDGFPKMLASPEKPSGSRDLAPRSLLRPGHRARALQKADSGGGDSIEPPSTMPGEMVREKLGYSRQPLPKGKAMKRPVASLAGTSKKVRKPWAKLYQVNAASPRRVYITGKKEGDDKAHLVVEISQARSCHFKQIAKRLLSALKTEHLTKAEALQLKASLLKEYG